MYLFLISRRVLAGDFDFTTLFGAVGQTGDAVTPTVAGLGNFEQLLDRDLAFVHPWAQGVRIGDFFYIVSGTVASQGIFTTEIERTQILADGSINLWQVAGTLPASRDQAAPAASSSNIYILGNHPGSVLVQRVPVSETAHSALLWPIAPCNMRGLPRVRLYTTVPLRHRWGQQLLLAIPCIC